MLFLTDLTRLTPLLEAYEALGQEMLAAAAEDPEATLSLLTPIITA